MNYKNMGNITIFLGVVSFVTSPIIPLILFLLKINMVSDLVGLYFSIFMFVCLITGIISIILGEILNHKNIKNRGITAGKLLSIFGVLSVILFMIISNFGLY